VTGRHSKASARRLRVIERPIIIHALFSLLSEKLRQAGRLM
jgi:hypothetical protein